MYYSFRKKGRNVGGWKEKCIRIQLLHAVVLTIVSAVANYFLSYNIDERWYFFDLNSPLLRLYTCVPLTAKEEKLTNMIACMHRTVLRLVVHSKKRFIYRKARRIINNWGHGKLREGVKFYLDFARVFLPIICVLRLHRLSAFFENMNRGKSSFSNR
jgi:hypothetical protein